jgi:DNA-binding response OmpR family regulator
MPPAQLNGLHVLIVEDDAMIGLLVEDILIDAGCHVCGPFIAFTAALQAADTEAVDLAILDVNLAGVLSYPIAEALEARGIPFVLTSGYGDHAAPPEHPGWPTCSKPFTSDTLTSAITAALGRGGAN